MKNRLHCTKPSRFASKPQPHWNLITTLITWEESIDSICFHWIFYLSIIILFSIPERSEHLHKVYDILVDIFDISSQRYCALASTPFDLATDLEITRGSCTTKSSEDKHLLRYEESMRPIQTKAAFLAQQQWIALKGWKMRWFRWKSIWKAFRENRVKGPEDNEKKFHYDGFTTIEAGPWNAKPGRLAGMVTCIRKHHFLSLVVFTFYV